jgi:hypothetical protein
MPFTVAGQESTFARPRMACARVSGRASPERRVPAWLATERSLTGCAEHLPDGTLLACAGQVVAIARDGRLRPLDWPGVDKLRWPADIAMALDGTLVVLVLDGGIARVWRVAPDRPSVRLGEDEWVGYADDFGGAAVAAAPNGDAFLLNPYRRTVTRLGPDGRTSPLAGTLVTNGPPPEGFAGDGGPATEAIFGVLGGLDALSDGSLVIADAGNDRVRQVGPDGIIRTIAGGDDRPWREGELATAMRLNQPRAVHAAADGTILIAENERLIRIARNGGAHTVAPVSGNFSGLPFGAREFNTDGRPLSASTLAGISALDALPDGSLAAFAGGRLALLTRGLRTERLAVALPARNRSLILRGAVEIYATRPARGRVRLVRGRHVLASAGVRLARGRNRVQLPVPRHNGAAQLRVSVQDARGKRASHHLTVIADTILAKGVLERLSDPIERSLVTGSTDVRLNDCQRESPRAFACDTVVTDEDGEQHVESRVFLRPDGLVEYEDEDTRALFEPPPHT